MVGDTNPLTQTIWYAARHAIVASRETGVDAHNVAGRLIGLPTSNSIIYQIITRTMQIPLHEKNGKIARHTVKHRQFPVRLT